MISRSEMVNIINTHILESVCKLYKLDLDELKLVPAHDGFQNIVYMTPEDKPEYIRVSFRKDRSCDDIEEEVAFINYLHENGVSVSNPILSGNGKFVEHYEADSENYYVVVFNKAKGIRLPDNGYRYRKGVSLDEYYYNQGKILGQIHRLSKNYVPDAKAKKRPDWLKNKRSLRLPGVIPDEQESLRKKIEHIWGEASKLPRDNDAFGLIHGDFGDGNFTIDYNTGDITVFDFDDSSYCWFMYDLADLWVSGVGWCQFEPDSQKREAFMRQYFNTVLSGYSTENSIDDSWLERLPFFIKLVVTDGLLSELDIAQKAGEEIEDDEEIQYMIKCIMDDIPYFGFFDEIYSEKAPFCLT